MIPNKFTLTGAIGIKAGLGRDSITMDLRALVPGDATTVALRGDNGMGKSTILNLALTPWRNPPHVDDIYAQFGADGLRELEFEHGGRCYKSVITIKQTAKTKSMSASLYFFDGDWRPVVLPDNTISDGKTSTYDACLSYVLGPMSIYFMSAFKSQNAKPLADHDDPKALMRDLLDLDEPDQLAEQAKDVARMISREIDASRDDLLKIDSLDRQLSEIEIELPRARASVVELDFKKNELINAAVDARAAYQSARESDAVNVENKKRYDDINQRITKANSDKRNAITQIESDISRVGNRLASYRQLLDKAAEVDAAEKRIPELAERLATLDNELQSLRKKQVERESITTNLSSIRKNASDVLKHGNTVKSSVDSLRTRAAFVDNVPCGGAVPYDKCPALRDAIAAKPKADTESIELNRLRDEWKKLDNSANELMNTLQSLPDYAVDIRSAEFNISKTNTELTRARETAAHKASLVNAQTGIDDAKAELVELYARKEATTNGFDNTLAGLTRELGLLPPLAQGDALRHAQTLMQRAENDLKVTAEKLDRTRADIANFESNRDSINAKLKSLESVRAEVKRLSGELAHWKLLSSALRGVIDLSIEDAGPAIAAIANRLLLEAYGPRFTLKIVTQKTQANGVIKECFDISVIDAESGIESSIIRKSGGEMVWLDKALTDAVALYHKDAAGIDYECLFADEAEDGLTDERKTQFYKMDRAALSIGGFKRKFFISHNPNAWTLADCVIDLSQYRA